MVLTWVIVLWNCSSLHSLSFWLLHKNYLEMHGVDLTKAFDMLDWAGFFLKDLFLAHDFYHIKLKSMIGRLLLADSISMWAITYLCQPVMLLSRYMQFVGTLTTFTNLILWQKPISVRKIKLISSVHDTKWLYYCVLYLWFIKMWKGIAESNISFDMIWPTEIGADMGHITYLMVKLYAI